MKRMFVVKHASVVITAKARFHTNTLDSRFRGNDTLGGDLVI